MNEQAECPICFIRLPNTGEAATNLSLHMSTHSKEEVVAALLGRTRSSEGSNLGPIPRMTQAVNLCSNHNTFIGGVSITRNLDYPAECTALIIVILFILRLAFNASSMGINLLVDISAINTAKNSYHIIIRATASRAITDWNIY